MKTNKGKIVTLNDNSSIDKIADIEPTSFSMLSLGNKKKKSKNTETNFQILSKYIGDTSLDKPSTNDHAAYILEAEINNPIKTLIET
jgi:hypothetical protein